jgi:hypothetical protein
MPEASGVVREIAEKPSGWSTISIDIGTQYPLKVDTKLQPIIELVRALGSNEGIFTYTESESDRINPNSGRPYVNRLLEGVTPRDAGQPVGQPVSESAEQVARQPISAGNKDRVIARLACVKAAAEMLRLNDGTVEEQISNTIAAAARFEGWVYRDIDEVPF